MVRAATPKRQQMIHEMIGVAGMLTRDLELKTKNQVMEVADVAQSTALGDLDSHVVETMRKAQDAMYAIQLFQNVDFQQLVDEHELTHGFFLLDSVDFVFIGSPYNFRSDCKEANFHYDVLTLEDIANTALH